MTQHRFSGILPDGRKFLALAGWDRMLGRFFLDVEQVPEHEKTLDDPVLIYESMLDPIAPARRWDYYEFKLRQLKINAPVGLKDALALECSSNAGNSVKDWGNVPAYLKLVT